MNLHWGKGYFRMFSHFIKELSCYMDASIPSAVTREP